MKITIVKKAETIRKPQNFCPWVIDEEGGPSRTTGK
jgi:hypothetical protein